MRQIITLLLLLIGARSQAQTGVTVTYYDGTTQGFNVTAAGKLYFESDNLNVKIDQSTTPTTIPVNIIRKIVFSNSLSTPIVGQNKKNLVLYPNPSASAIRIQSESGEALDTKIYSLTGQLVLQGTFQSGEEINVSELSSGLYLVQANGVTIKFSKK